MSAREINNKKAGTRTAKSAAAKKPAAKAKTSPLATLKAKSKGGAKSGLLDYDMFKAVHQELAKRPPNNPDMPIQYIRFLEMELDAVKAVLEEYAQHLRSLDRRRLNGVGIKKQGFVDRALSLATENSEFLPHYLTLEKFNDDYKYFAAFRALTDLAQQVRELLWNITILAADVVYTDGLDFYASVREAAMRRVDAAESIFNELSPFFKGRGNRLKNGEQPETKKQIEREVKRLLDGKEDGEIIIKNVNPKATGGERKVIEKKITDSERFKKTDEGEIKE